MRDKENARERERYPEGYRIGYRIRYSLMSYPGQDFIVIVLP